jgi:hypothetical protein
MRCFISIIIITVIMNLDMSAKSGSPQQFGARADGVIFDNEAIQCSINECDNI